MTKAQQQEQNDARVALREIVKPGDKVFTILRHVSRSGMQRVIGVVVPTADGLRDITWSVSKAIGYPNDRDRWGVKVNGCGMDMGFEVVYNLGRVLWADGVPCAGEEPCYSNDHSNGMREYGPAIIHPDGGYALRPSWL